MITPTEVRRLAEAGKLHIRWNDGSEDELDLKYLRGWCPCAGCQGHGGEMNFVEADNTDLVEINLVGNYALGLVWGDGHDTGIYSYRHLLALRDRERFPFPEPAAD